MTPIQGTEIKCKPDLVLFDNIKSKWGNIRACAELTVSQYKHRKQPTRAADTQAYLLLSNQLWRCFVLILSFTNGYNDLRVLLYDNSGGAVSPSYNISHHANTFAQIIATVIFGSLECIRYNATITFWKNILLPLLPGAHIPSCHPFKNHPDQANTTDMATTLPLDELPEDPQEGLSSGAVIHKLG
ncbi:hypothetical protein BD769DRAFT_1658208 [Suillus cothurnatus]|nr:hypothetical protein BD769DRAFT_1658208 [Suillus cothurnatus]